MGVIPEHELLALKAMSGYDQMLEMDRLCRVYSTDEATLRDALTKLNTMANQVNPQSQNSTQSWDTSYKEAPQFEQQTRHLAANVIDKSQFRFEYDPTREANARRQQVNQAILCSACGVALGIPNIRPIKVTCPSCLFEATYTQ